MTPVTDPELLKQLNGSSGQPVTDPALLAELNGASQLQSEAPKGQDLLSDIYTGVLAGGAMTIGGTAGAIVGAPTGPVGSALAGVAGATAMYPLAKRGAEAIDRFRGITPPPQESLPSELGEGLAIEAGGAVLKPALKVGGKVLGKILPGARTGEMLSGTPALNLKRAYKQGFTETYLKPKALSKAGEEFGDAKFNMIKDVLTPEEQVGMMVNPRGEANTKVADVMTKWIKGEEITAPEALAARQGIDTIFPPDVARKQTQRGGLSQFRSVLNDIIGEKNPEFKAANTEYAKSKLRSQLLKPMRVNKSNPDQYSKLGGMLNALGLIGGASTGAVLPAIGAALGSSPLAMGLTSSIAGSASRAASGPVSDVVRRAALQKFIDEYMKKNGR